MHSAHPLQRTRAVREEDKLERRRDILSAAEKLFLARPEGLASMDELAGAAGVAKGTLYLYFPSKEEVLVALHERNVHRVFDAIDADMAAKAKSKTRLTLQDLSRLARHLIIESPIYLPLATLVIGFIGRSIPVDVVVRFHLSIMERVNRSGKALEAALGLPAGGGARLIEYTHAFVLGLWQLSGCGRIVADNLRNAPPEMLFMAKEDPAEIQRALETLWSGMLTAQPARARGFRRRASPAKRKVHR
jgi:AcrR family transcriptional regulator